MSNDVQDDQENKPQIVFVSGGMTDMHNGIIRHLQYTVDHSKRIEFIEDLPPPTEADKRALAAVIDGSHTSPFHTSNVNIAKELKYIEDAPNPSQINQEALRSTLNSDNIDEMFTLARNEDPSKWREILRSKMESDREPTVIFISDPTVADRLLEIEERDRRLAQNNVVIIGGSSRRSSPLSLAIAVTLASMAHRPLEIPEITWDADFPQEFRYSDLHYRLSLEATKIKDQRKQQSRKAKFLFHEKKRVQKGRSHAKQKHKGMARYA